MYNASQFMIYAKEFLGFQVKQEAIDEVRDVGQQDKNYDVMSGNTDIFGYKQRVQELVDSPAHQMMLDYLSSTDFEKVRNAQLDKKNYWVVGDKRE